MYLRKEKRNQFNSFSNILSMLRLENLFDNVSTILQIVSREYQKNKYVTSIIYNIFLETAKVKDIRIEKLFCLRSFPINEPKVFDGDPNET